MYSVSYGSPQRKIEAGRRKINFFAAPGSMNKLRPEGLSPAQGDHAAAVPALPGSPSRGNEGIALLNTHQQSSKAKGKEEE